MKRSPAPILSNCAKGHELIEYDEDPCPLCTALAQMCADRRDIKAAREILRSVNHEKYSSTEIAELALERLDKVIWRLNEQPVVGRCVKCGMPISGSRSVETCYPCRKAAAAAAESEAATP